MNRLYIEFDVSHYRLTPTTMQHWQINPQISFSSLYLRPRPAPPPNRSRSYATKNLSAAEIMSGLALKNLCYLSVPTLELPGHSYEWAINVLTQHGPDSTEGQFCTFWKPNFMVTPSAIESEEDTKSYTIATLLHPILPGAICIHENAMNLTPSGFPYDRLWEIADLGSHGRNGRCDSCYRSKPHPDNKVAGIEFKTDRVGSSLIGTAGTQSVNIFDHIATWIGPEMDDVPMCPPGSEQGHFLVFYQDLWKKKLQTILFQVCSLPKVNEVEINFVRSGISNLPIN